MSCSKWGRWVIFKVKLNNFEVLSKYDQVFLKLYLMSALKIGYNQLFGFLRVIYILLKVGCFDFPDNFGVRTGSSMLLRNCLK